MPMREEQDVQLKCGHWVNSLGAVHVLGEGLGKLSQWCARCGDWKYIKPPPKKKKARINGDSLPFDDSPPF